jgi:hypothetical protein
VAWYLPGQLQDWPGDSISFREQSPEPIAADNGQSTLPALLA